MEEDGEEERMYSGEERGGRRSAREDGKRFPHPVLLRSTVPLYVSVYEYGACRCVPRK